LSIARRVRQSVLESAHFEYVVLDLADRQRDLASEHRLTGILYNKGRIDADSNCQSKADFVAALRFSMARREAANGRSDIILRITRFGRTGAGFFASSMEHWCRGLHSVASASLAGAHV
jgi:hypothetical protein